MQSLLFTNKRALTATYAGKFVVVALSYALLVYVSSYLGVNTSGLLVVWPPAAFGLAVLFLYGIELWPALVLPLFLVLLSRGISPPFAVGIVLGNTLEMIAGAYVLSRFSFRPTLARLGDSLSLILIASSVSTITASIVSLFSYAVGPSAGTIYTQGWVQLWIGHAVSILVFGPFFFYWLNRIWFTKTRAEIIEGIGIFGSIAAIITLLTWTQYGSLGPVSLVYVLIFPLVWASLRAGPRGISLALALIGLISVSGVLYGWGPLAHSADVGQTFLSIQVLVGFFAIIFLPFTSTTEERKDAVIALEQHVTQLEDALVKISSDDQAKSDFIAILAHELRNPLSPILSSLELMTQQGTTAANAPHVSSIQSHVHMMARLLDDLLDISRITQKKFKLQVEPVEFRQVLDQAAEIVQPLIGARGHTLSIEAPPTPVWLSADPVRLTQVFVNLLNNAAKYTNPGGSIALTSALSGGFLVVRVRDNGQGIPAERLPYIFDSFGGAVTPTRGPGGLHIGLSIAKRMIELHRGSIEVKSEGVGKGSEFIVRLPVPAAAPLPLTANTKRRRQRFSALRAEPARVLVVDDNRPAADSLAKLLSNNGHKVAVAYDGREAIERAHAEAPEAAILDIGLPDMDGYELCRRMRERFGSSIILIAVTGYGQAEDQERAKESGFDAHLVKPVSISDVERMLSDLRP